ncbi:acyl carrier protein [Kangiella shandongensis]|uniref:hypothetical protein n=1 Tax=Kangiella shandongensis TaxID=2763258 RepID=UPI001CBAE6D8|nr:hypothetical protein [Kangiella shandongensis]
MGLDTVEFILDIEAEYRISIPDSDAEGLGILEELAKYIANKTNKAQYKDKPDAVMETLVTLLSTRYEIPIEQIKPNSHLIRNLGLD